MAHERILIVEDDLLNMELAADILELHGYRIHKADNGFRALQLLRTTPIDLIVMDIQLPDFDGISLCREIRGNPCYRTIPIIAFTAHAMKGDEQKFLSAGFNSYVAKPIDTRQFPLLIAECLGGGGCEPPEDHL